MLIAVGVILPHGGQCLRVRPAHHERRPPYSLMRTVRGERVPFTLRAGAEPRQTRRETFLATTPRTAPGPPAASKCGRTVATVGIVEGRGSE